MLKNKHVLLVLILGCTSHLMAQAPKGGPSAPDDSPLIEIRDEGQETTAANAADLSAVITALQMAVVDAQARGESADDLVPLLIQVIQRQQQLITEQKEELGSLEESATELYDRLSRALEWTCGTIWPEQ